MFDFAIIGGGVVGVNIAYLLSKKYKVAIITQNEIGFGASSAAGAFLSPLLGKTNYYNNFINKSLSYSLEFYSELKSQNFYKTNLFRVPNDKISIEKLKNDSKIFNAKEFNFNNIDGVILDNAGLVNSSEMLKELSKESSIFENSEVTSLKFENSNWKINNTIQSKNIILTTGAKKPLLSHPYIDIIPYYGQRIEIETSTKIDFNIHKNISVSMSKNSNRVVIGATKNRDKNSSLESENIHNLLKEANELIELKSVKVIDTRAGYRATLKSYFPVVGRIIDEIESLKLFPQIKNGTNVNSNRLKYYPNSFIINGVGSRGFVLAPYLAKILFDNIEKNTTIEKNISTEKLFYKWARKQG